MTISLLPASFDKELFLREYWQKKPLLIRGNGQFHDPISPEDLAGLACEEAIESRLIMGDAEASQWTLSHGPFPEETLRSLPTSHWSLLVQALDQWDEGVRDLLREFDFIPRWRIDDIMLSLASDGGGVGPHFDYYDVFLIQGMGKKRWRLGGRADSNSALRPDTELRLLEEFITEEDWIVEPGDILYIPPNIAHYGESIGLSMTYSIGFRAPSAVEMVDDLCNELMHTLPEELRYVDTAPQLPQHSGEISPQVSAQLAALVREVLLDEQMITRSFGRFMTRPKYPEVIAAEDMLSTEELSTVLQDPEMLLQRHPISRFAFAGKPPMVDLYVDGHAFACPPAFAALLPQLCDPFAPELPWAQLMAEQEDNAELIVALYNQGSLYFTDDDEDEEDEEA